MQAEKEEKLDAAVAAIQKRWGTQAIGRSSQQLTNHVASVTSGFPVLDAAIGSGGIPRGRISELMGAPTSGMTSLALTVVARFHAEDGMVVYLDLERSFDPAHARHFGVLPDRLMLVHPYSAGQALDMLPDMVQNGGFELLICDMPAQVQQEETVRRKLASTLGRVLAPLSKGDMTLLFLTMLTSAQRDSGKLMLDYPQQATLPHFATLQLLLQKESWLYQQRDVCGYEVLVTVIKNKLAAPGKQARIAIYFDEQLPGFCP